MTNKNFHKNTIKYRKNSKWLRCSGNSEKQENDTNIKILKFQDNYHKPSLIQRLEQFFNVTPCDKKCNIFILILPNTLIRILHMGIIPYRRDMISPFVENIENGKNNESHKYMIDGIYSNIMPKWLEKIFHIHTIPIQWIRKIGKDTKFIILTNSCNSKKVVVNPV